VSLLPTTHSACNQTVCVIPSHALHPRLACPGKDLAVLHRQHCRHLVALLPAARSACDPWAQQQLAETTGTYAAFLLRARELAPRAYLLRGQYEAETLREGLTMDEDT
jgi:hypothetical protein